MADFRLAPTQDHLHPALRDPNTISGLWNEIAQLPRTNPDDHENIPWPSKMPLSMGDGCLYGCETFEKPLFCINSVSDSSRRGVIRLSPLTVRDLRLDLAQNGHFSKVSLHPATIQDNPVNPVHSV